MKPQLFNRVLSALFASSGLLSSVCVAGGTIVTNNTSISAGSFTFMDNGWPGYSLVSQGSNGGDPDSYAFGDDARWASDVNANYGFTGLTANASYNVYATWHGGGSVGMTAKVGATTVGTANQSVLPSAAGNGFTAYDDVNDLADEVHDFQLLGNATTDASGNLTLNVTKTAGNSFVRWDCFAVAPAPPPPPPGPRYWDGNASAANSASDNTFTAAMDWLNGGNWDNGTTSVPQGAWNPGDSATFGGTMAGTQTITLAGAITTSGLTFDTAGYTISGGAVASTGSLTLTTNAEATIDSTVSGAPILKEGTGTLVLGKATGGAASLTINSGKVSINTAAFNSLGNPSAAITINAAGVLSADNTASNAHNLGTVTLNGGTLTSANGPVGPGNDDGYGNWLLNAGGSGVIVGGTSASTISSTTLDVGTRSFTVTDATVSPDTDLTVSAAIIGGALTKTGPGTMELTGANTYAGATTVDEGTLKVGAASSLGSSSTVTVTTGATLDLSASAALNLGSGKTLKGGGAVIGAVTVDSGTINATGPLSVTTLDVTSTAALEIVPGPGSLTITDPDGLNTGASGNLVYVDLGTVPITSGTYQLIHYQGAIQGDDGFAAFLLGYTPEGDYTYELVQNGTSIDLVVSPLAKLWTGALDSKWSTAVLGAPKNWKAGLNQADFVTGDDVLFDDSAANTTVSINAANVSPSSVLFSNHTKSYTLQGSSGIAGAIELTKAGAGLLTIDTNNSFTGISNLNGGTLSVAAVADGGANSPLGAGTEIVFGGGTLAYSGGDAGTDRTMYLDLDGTVAVTSPGSTLTLSGEITGGGSLIKAGAGTLTPTFDNTYYGPTRINAGSLSVPTLPDGGIASPLGESSNAAASLVLAGGTLSYTGAGETSDRGFTLVAETTSGIAVTDSNAVLTLSGTVAGTGSFVKAGPGTLVRSTNMRNYAQLTVAEGRFAVSTPDFNCLDFYTPVEIDAGASLSAENSLFNAHNLGDLTLNGGTLTSINGPTGPANDDGFGNWVVASVTVGGATPSTINSTTLLMKTTGTGTFEVPDVTGSAATDLLVAAAIVEDGIYTIGAPLAKTGDGTLELTGRNTYTGNTTVDAGTLILADDARLTFVISNTDGVTNKLTGAGTVTLDGDFAIDTSAVTSLTTGTWQLENVTSLPGAYGASFTVIDPDGSPWTDAGSNQWTKTAGGKQWTFDETTGTLISSEAPGFASWITGFGLDAADQDPTDDPDGDGATNLVEYALAGRNPAVADGAAGSFTDGLLSFAKRTDATGITYSIQVSDDLGLIDDWTEVGSYVENTAATISSSLFPVTGARKFARLSIQQVNP